MYRCISQFRQRMHLRQFWCLKSVLTDESGVNKAIWAPGEPNMRHLRLKQHQTLRLGLLQASKKILFQREPKPHRQFHHFSLCFIEGFNADFPGEGHDVQNAGEDRPEAQNYK